MANSVVKLSVDDSSFNAKIKRAAQDFADFGKRVASAGVDAFGKFAKGVESAKVAFQGFNTALKANALVLVASLATEAAVAIGEMIGDWISGANDAEDAQKKLNDELEKTAQAIQDINSVADFDARIAKAAGKSTTEILKMKYNAADLAYNTAMTTLMNPNIKVGSEEYDKAKKMLDDAEKRRRKAYEDLKVDETARQYKTGEYAPKGGGSGRSGGKSEKNINEIVANQWDKASVKAELNAASIKPDDIFGPSEEWEKFKNVITGCSDSIADFSLETSKWTKNFDPIKDYLKKEELLLKQQQMAFNAAAQSAINFGGALGNIEDPGLKAAGTVISAIANIALGFGQAVAQAGSMGPYAWLAYVAAGTAALATTISMVHSLTGYAQGGIVQGNSYSGDNIPAMLNAGETVLTAAQTNTLASNIRNAGLGNMNLTATVTGEQIRFVLNANGRRTGHGEYLQSSFLRS